MCKFLSSGCSIYLGFNATLVVVVFSCHTGDCKHLTKNARQCFFGHPCLLSLNPLRESIQLLLWKKGYPEINPKHYYPCQITAFLKPQSWTKEDAFFRRSSQRAHSNIMVIYSIVALIKTLGSMFLSCIFKYSLFMVTVPRYPK